MVDHHYKGEYSEAFWELIHVLDDNKKTLFDLGMELQNLEEKVLKKMNERYQLIEQLKIENEMKTAPHF